MITANDFFDKYNNKPLDFDGYYGNQCVDLAQYYNKEVVGGPAFTGNAIDIPKTYSRDYYTWITNTPSNVPQLGDIIIWGAPVGAYIDNLGVKRYAGHIAVFKNGGVLKFTSFDQNWPTGSVCHFQDHNYSNVLGWLRPKVQQTPIVVAQSPVSATITDQTIIPLGVNPKTSTDWTGELQAVRSRCFDLENQRDDLANRLTLAVNNQPVPPATNYPANTNFVVSITEALKKVVETWKTS